MAKIRRDTIIDGLFLDIASPEEIRIVDDLYSRGMKGSAVVYQLKRIRAVWVKMINKRAGNGQASQTGIIHPIIF